MCPTMETSLAFCSSLQATRNAETCSLWLRGEGGLSSVSRVKEPKKISLSFSLQEGIPTAEEPALGRLKHSSAFINPRDLGLLGPTIPRSPRTNIQCSATMETQGLPTLLFHGIMEVLQQDPATWTSSVAANSLFLVVGFPALRVGLTVPAMASAFFLGTVSWKAFGPQAFFLLVFYFILGTGVTKVKIKQKEKEGIAEKRSGKRGPSSVWGSGAAGIACAVFAIVGLGGSDLSYLWQLGFAASFATKLSDTVSSEIGKAYGTTTYLVTTLKVVPRGTEGAVSLEGTLAGLIASILFCALAYNLNQVIARDALICIIGSQIANLLESYAGATLQDKKGFEWLNNDVVNVLNISFGAALAIAASYACDLL